MRHSTFFFLALIAAIVQAVPAADLTKPPAGTCTISAVAVDAPDVDTDGSGCRAGTVGVAFSSDNSLMTILFDDFKAAIGPNAGSTKKRAFCRVNVTMASPGWAFDVSSVDFRGYVRIAQGVDASIVSRWKWIDSKGQDMKGKGNINKKLAGPFEDDFLLHKDGELSDNEASVCSKASARFQLSISASLSASGSSLSGLVQGDAANAQFGEVLNLGWKKC
ncbi:uncharacterized protein BDR25DRAFT_336951 [Lindgomyces ingoldianus]|uniref:Uncharacterized protein n=1 Tax=Lindgomyces ingoldianus TaxID=673940 RepID=A0ACB6QEU5_9PLEO|nr:uncharacterized protein BDR25DRAFT_336951 [Lindgomyces ingoldianus]KAF2465539.1 hypothetical protein BDR25DRAFT_336951 [Lindgomyces ingoldianus]